MRAVREQYNKYALIDQFAELRGRKVTFKLKWDTLPMSGSDEDEARPMRCRRQRTSTHAAARAAAPRGAGSVGAVALGLAAFDGEDP